MKFLILIFCSISVSLYSQSTKQTLEAVSGTYGLGSALDLQHSLYLNKNKTFEYLLKSKQLGNDIHKGTWKIAGDTLILISSKELFGKYIISSNKVCEIQTKKTEDALICLDRQK